MILKMSTRLRVGVAREIVLGYGCTLFYSQHVLKHRETSSVEFLKYIKRNNGS